MESQGGKAEAHCGHNASHRPNKFIWNLVCGKERVSCGKWQRSWGGGDLLLQHDLPYPGSQYSWPLLFSWRSEIERPSCAIGVHLVRGWNLRQAGGTAHCDSCTPDTIHGFPVAPSLLIFLQTDFNFTNNQQLTLFMNLGRSHLISDKTKS